MLRGTFFRAGLGYSYGGTDFSHTSQDRIQGSAALSGHGPMVETAMGLMPSPQFALGFAYLGQWFVKPRVSDCVSDRGPVDQCGGGSTALSLQVAAIVGQLYLERRVDAQSGAYVQALFGVAAAHAVFTADLEGNDAAGPPESFDSLLKGWAAGLGGGYDFPFGAWRVGPEGRLLISQSSNTSNDSEYHVPIGDTMSFTVATLGLAASVR